MVDKVIDALISAGAKNEAPPHANYEVYRPGAAYLDRSAPGATPEATYLEVPNVFANGRSAPLSPAVAQYLEKLLYSRSSCTDAAPSSSINECIRSADPAGSRCTVQYFCLRF